MCGQGFTGCYRMASDSCEDSYANVWNYPGDYAAGGLASQQCTSGGSGPNDIVCYDGAVCMASRRRRLSTENCGHSETCTIGTNFCNHDYGTDGCGEPYCEACPSSDVCDNYGLTESGIASCKQCSFSGSGSGGSTPNTETCGSETCVGGEDGQFCMHADDGGSGDLGNFGDGGGSGDLSNFGRRRSLWGSDDSKCVGCPPSATDCDTSTKLLEGTR